MILSILLACCSYFETYTQECTRALQFISENPAFSEILCNNIGKNDAVIAESIVAPEISQYSAIENQMQIRTLYLLYVSSGVSNFSIGFLQMKPSFAEQIEMLVRADGSLKRKYSKLIITKGDIKETRRIRIERLCSLRWQLEYLSAFMQIANKRIGSLVKGKGKRIKYLATMYNGGISLKINEIEYILNTKQFPHWGFTKFNYADCALEFYKKINESKV